MTTRLDLRDIVNATWLRARAGKRTFDYGGAYFHSNMVQLGTVSETLIDGNVDDGTMYSSRIWIEDESVQHACTCEEGERRPFCKHLVALGLTWLERAKTEPGTVFSGYPELQLLERYLHSLPREALVDLLITHSDRDTTLRRHLQGLAARHIGEHTTPLQESVLKIITRLRSGTAPQRLAADIENIASILEDTCAAGHAALACDLGERALERASFAVRTHADPAGHLAASLKMLRESLARAQTAGSTKRGIQAGKAI